MPSMNCKRGTEIIVSLYVGNRKAFTSQSILQKAAGWFFHGLLRFSTKQI